MPMPTPPCPASSASPPGCGATPWSRLRRVAARHNAAAGRAGRLLRPRPVQPVHARSRSAGLPRHRPGSGPAWRASATPASTTTAKTASTTATRPASACQASCEEGVIEQLRPECSGAPSRIRGRQRRQFSSTPSRTRAWCAMPRNTTAPCSAAGSRPGTCATATWWRRWRRWRSTCRSMGNAGQDRRLGAQLAHRRRPRHRDGRPGRVERRPAGPRPPTAPDLPDRLLDLPVS
jgi:hypothetical protein